ncbi:MAG: exo-alpha-sialidase [Bacteroidales bacterium]|nr:exo-alpha-sialidase [Bacteroidales bacterium]
MKRKHLGILLFILIITGCTAHYEDITQHVSQSKLDQKNISLFMARDNPAVIQVNVVIPDTEKRFELHSVQIYMKEGSRTDFLESLSIQHIKNINGYMSESVFGGATGFAAEQITVNGLSLFEPGSHTLSFNFGVKEDALLEQSFRIENIELVFDHDQNLVLEPDRDFSYRPALVLRQSGQDNCDTYRIPGLVTTNEGTLVAVYDNRYNRSKDLQENIDIGMSRSTDGGQSWEPMRVIMDMGEWGGRPESLNGIGDPCILYDHNNSTLWVAALWMSGLTPEDMLWWSSQPGMSPEETGQFILVKSTDDGLTWSDTINITEQVKDPGWQLMLQGPGRGITMDDGTLVFPAQFKADIGETAIDGGQFTSHSTIVYSRDGGETWQTGTGARSNTTEAQVVQLTDGKLMLNMRDDRNSQVKDESNGRAVAVTGDMGQTWTIHPSSNSSLPEPTCMASLIAADIVIEGEKQQVLFFSNPNNKYARKNMTIKASLDGGLTWPQEYQQELNEEEGDGYSCLTMVGEDKIAILYEGVKELYFQLVPVGDIIAGK